MCVRLHDPRSNSAVIGGFRVGWPYERVVSDASRTQLATIASMVELALSRIRLSEEIQRDQFRSVLDSMLDNVAIGRALRDAEGQIVDFVIEFVNSSSLDGAGRDRSDMENQRVCDLYPGWKESGMLDSFISVVNSGVPFVAERLEYCVELADDSYIPGWRSLQVVKYGDG